MKLKLLLTSVIFCLCAGGPAVGAVIFSNGDPLTGNPGSSPTHYVKSDTIPSSFIAADNFTLPTNASVDSVSWWGAWNFFQPGIDNFTIDFYGDAGGVPDKTNRIATRNVGNIIETSTGLTRSFYSLLHFQASIAPVSFVAGQNYWLSIYEDSGSNTSQYFIWRIIAGAGSGALSNDNRVTWSAASFDVAFQLDGIATAVAEPSSIGLFLIGAAGLICFSTRTRRPA